MPDRFSIVADVVKPRKGPKTSWSTDEPVNLFEITAEIEVKRFSESKEAFRAFDRLGPTAEPGA